jgi:hypothetical protein
MRVDIGALQQKTIGIDPSDDILADEVGSAPRVYIWGTRICVEDVQKQFYSFICEYKTLVLDDDENAILMDSGEMLEIDSENPYYLEKLKGINLSEVPILSLNLGHVMQYNGSLYKLIVAYPDVI